MVTEYDPGTKNHARPQPSGDAKTDFRPAYLDKIEMPQGDVLAVAAHAVPGPNNSRRLAAAAARRASRRRTNRRMAGLVDSGGGRWAAMNTQAAPFDDINVRKAVVASFDRRAVLLALGGQHIGVVATHFLPPGAGSFAEAGAEQGSGLDFLAHESGDAALAAKYMRAAGFASRRTLRGRRGDPHGRPA